MTCPPLLSDTGNTIVISITLKLKKKKKKKHFGYVLTRLYQQVKRSQYFGNTLQYYLNLTLSITEKCGKTQAYQ